MVAGALVDILVMAVGSLSDTLVVIADSYMCYRYMKVVHIDLNMPVVHNYYLAAIDNRVVVGNYYLAAIDNRVVVGNYCTFLFECSVGECE